MTRNFRFCLGRTRIGKLHPVMVGFIALGSLLLLHSLSYKLNHDEEQFIAAGFLGTKYELYKDFIYLQTPYFSYLLSSVFRFMNSNYFITARVIVWLMSFGSVLLIFIIAKRMVENSWAAFAFAALFGTSSLMAPAFGMARNDIMPCFFSLLGITLISTTSKETRLRILSAFLGGMALAVAVGTKASYAFVPLTIVASELIITLRSNPQAKSFLPLGAIVIGGMVGAIPIAIYAVRYWDAFYFQNLVYHITAPYAWYQMNGMADALSWEHHFQTMALRIYRDATLAFGILIVFLSVYAFSIKRYETIWNAFLERRGGLYFALAMFGVISAFSLRPPHAQYFQPIVPFFTVLAIAVYGSFNKIRALRIARGALLATLVILTALPRSAMLLQKSISGITQGLTVTRINDVSHEISKSLEELGLAGKIATLSPIRIIDSGLPIYREFSSGPFFFRTGDLYDQNIVRSFNGASPNTLDEILDADPPVAILIGYETRWSLDPDAALERYARSRSYSELNDNFGGGRLFVKK